MLVNKSLQVWVETASFSENLILGFAQTLLMCTAAVTLHSQIYREYKISIQMFYGDVIN